MTKKHFELVAKTLADTRPGTELWASREQWDRTVEHLARAFAQINPNFNRDRFVAACGGR